MVGCALTSDGEILVCSDDRGFVWMQRSDTLVNVLKFDTCVKLLRVFGTHKNSVIVAVDDRNCAKVRTESVWLFIVTVLVFYPFNNVIILDIQHHAIHDVSR